MDSYCPPLPLPHRPSADAPPSADAATRLARGDLRAWAHLPQDATIVCLAGDVWITQAGLSADVVLRGGQSFVCRRRGKVVVQALTHATIRLQS